MRYSYFARKIYFPLTQKIKGEKIKSYLKVLEESQYLSPEIIKRVQWEKIKKLISYAYENINYYKRVFDNNSIHPNDIKSIEDFQSIPFLTKDIVRSEFSSLCNHRYRGRIYAGETSGSTGIPLKFFVTPEYNSWDWASRWRARRWFGVNIGDSEIAIWGRPVHKTWKRCWNQMKAAFGNKILLSGFNLSEERLDRYSRIVFRFAPSYIYGYSESVYQLASYIRENFKNKSFKNLKAIFVTAETLIPEQRRVIEEVFGVPVSNEYGCSEIGGFAYECPEGNWHISSENVFVEFVPIDNYNKEIFATSITNYYMPFIRYRIGDIGDKIDGMCPCGRSLPLMKLRTGKVTDIVVLKDGRLFSSEIFDYLNLALLDMNLKPFKQFQVIQNSTSEFDFNFVKGEDYNENSKSITKRLLLNVLKDRSIKINFNEVQSIPKDSSGKLRYFISKCYNT